MSSAGRSVTCTQRQVARRQSNEQWNECDGYVFGPEMSSASSSNTEAIVPQPPAPNKRGRPKKVTPATNRVNLPTSPVITANSRAQRIRRSPEVFSPSNFRDSRSGRTQSQQSQHELASSQVSQTVANLSSPENTHQHDVPDEEDIFLARAGISGETQLLEIPPDQLGVLAMLPNSVTYIPRRLIAIVRKTYHKLLAQALQPHQDPEQELIAYKKLFLVPAVLFTATKPNVFAQECTRKCELIMNDDWSSFTLASLGSNVNTGQNNAHARQGSLTIDAAQRRKERGVKRCTDAGNLRKAMQRVVNDSPPVTGSEDILHKLQAKHPTQLQAQQTAIRYVPVSAPPIALHADDVSWAIRMAKKCVKHGLDKLRSEHLQHVVLGSEADRLLKLFTDLCTKIANNNIDERLLPYIRDAEIIAAPKGDNDVRPIVICGTIRKITLSAVRRALDFTKNKLFNQQFGLAKGGSEKVIMAMRHAKDLDESLNVVILDATNAFNSASRNKAMDMVEEHFPAMIPIVQAFYGTSATIWYNGMASAIEKVLAEVGFQQGCVLGSWLYCLSLQKLVDLIFEALDDDGLPLFYIDDGNLIATFEATLRAFKVLKEKGPEFGYNIKWKSAQYLMGKCESVEEAANRRAQLMELGFSSENIITHPSNVQEADEPHHKQYGVIVLGGFVGSDEYIADQLTSKLQSTQGECNALIKLSDLQTRFMLLHWCFKSKAHYWLRTTKLALLDTFINGFEAQKRAVLTSIMDYRNNSGTTTVSDLTWKITQHAIKHGGLGMENLHHVKYAAIIAATFLVKGVVLNEDQLKDPLKENEKSSIVRDFHTAHNKILSVDTSLNWGKLKEMSQMKTVTLQHKLTETLQKQEHAQLMSTVPGPHALPASHYNWLNSLQSKEAGLWLTVGRTIDFKFTNEEFQVALLHRCYESQPSLLPNFVCKCSRGEGRVDERAHHLFTGCSKGGVRHETHDKLTMTLYTILRVYGIHARHEVCPFKEIEPNSKERLDIVITKGQLGYDKRLLLDVTVTNPVNANTRNSRVRQDAAGEIAYKKKLDKYELQALQTDSVVKPVVFESTGRVHPETLKLFKRIAGVNEGETNIDNYNLYKYWMRVISVTLQKGLVNAFVGGRRRLMSNSYCIPAQYTTNCVNEYNDLYVVNNSSSDE